MVDQALEARIASTTAVKIPSNTHDSYNPDGEPDDTDQTAALFKLIIIGDTGVGKSCLLAKLIRDDFNQEHQVTIGVEFGNYAMCVNDDTLIKLQIWDTAGQESFRSITRIFYKGSHAVMLVFDITTRSSFENIRTWKKEIENNAEEGIVCYLVGNFADLENEREVTRAEALEMVKELGFAHYMETSAYTGMNVSGLFERITKHLFCANEHKLNDYVSVLNSLKLPGAETTRRGRGVSCEAGASQFSASQGQTEKRLRLLIHHQFTHFWHKLMGFWSFG